MSREIGGSYIEPVKSDGTLAERAGARGFYTLAVATYYVDIGDLTSPILSLHLQWDAGLVGTITLECGNAGNQEASLWSTTSGDWLQENPSTAYVPIVGTGASVANLTITLAGGGVGGSTINLADYAHARGRLKLVITTAGTFRCARNRKGRGN